MTFHYVTLTCHYVTITGEFYLGYVDKIGVSFESNSVATGFGGYIAQPMMRKAMEGNYVLIKQKCSNTVKTFKWVIVNPLISPTIKKL